MSLVKEGWYKVEIADIEWKANRAGTGHYLKLGYKIQAHSEYKDKTIYEYLNFDNPNPIAVDIAQKNWKTICHCIDFKNAPDVVTEVTANSVKRNLAYQELTIKIKHKTNDEGYTNYNIADRKPFGSMVGNNKPAQTSNNSSTPPKDEAPPPTSEEEYAFLDDNIPF
jgi:hypothetical protein